MAQINLLLQAETSQAKKNVDNYTRSLNQNATAGTKASQATQAVGTAARGTVAPIRGAGVDMRNLSYQIQDVAVQAGMGTDALRIMSMQGPQIASAFGPAGAAYGAVIAIAGAVAGALLPSLMSGKDAFEELLDTVEGLDDILTISNGVVSAYSDRIVHLANVNRDAARVLITGGMIELEQAIYRANEALDKQGAEYERLFRRASVSLQGSDLALGAFGLTLSNLDPSNIEDVLAASEEIRVLLARGDLTDAQREELVAVQQNILAIQEANNQLTELNALEEALGNNVNITTEALVTQNAQLQQLNDGLQQINTSTQTYADLQNQRSLSMANTNAMMQQQLQTTQQVSSQEISFATKAKDALLSTNAGKIISTSYSAAMKAYEALAGIPIIGPALGAAAAATIIGQGARFASQSVRGRALGGQVRGGETYLVGERGPELLTMGSKGGFVTPNDQLRQQTVNNAGNVANVTFNITANDTAGFDELLNKRRGQIIGMVNQALNNSGRRNLV